MKFGMERHGRLYRKSEGMIEVRVLAFNSEKIDIVDDSLSIETTKSSWFPLEIGKERIHSSCKECSEDAIPIFCMYTLYKQYNFPP